MKINYNEPKITGKWILEGTRVVEDENCKRINWLRNNHLKQISIDDTGWIVLYQDPEDMRYWELIYEQGDLQGGGPPSLILLTEDEVLKKYSL